MSKKIRGTKKKTNLHQLKVNGQLNQMSLIFIKQLINASLGFVITFNEAHLIDLYIFCLVFQVVAE